MTEAPYPRKAVTRRKLGVVETSIHAFLTVATAGLWGFVWAWRRRSHRTVTKYK